jgi:hypothetical protein
MMFAQRNPLDCTNAEIASFARHSKECPRCRGWLRQAEEKVEELEELDSGGCLLPEIATRINERVKGMINDKEVRELLDPFYPKEVAGE